MRARPAVRHTGRAALAALLGSAACLVGGCVTPFSKTAANGPPKKPPPPVNITVEIGQAGAARQGQVVPIKVTLGQNERPITGTLELDDFHGGKSEMPIELPRQANKVYTLFAALRQPDDRNTGEWADLRVREGGGVLVHQYLMPTDPGDAKVLVSSTDDGSGLQFLDDQRHYRVAHLAPRDLPRQWAGYQPASVVALNGRAWSAMDDDQRRAFRTWVENGGRAILCAEATNEWRDPEAQAVAPITPAHLQTEQELSCLNTWGDTNFRPHGGSILTVDGPLAPGAWSVEPQNGRVVVAGRKALAGRVLWLGFDAFRQTFREWDGYERFWKRAVEFVEKEQGPGEVQDPDQVETARTAASSLPKLPTPPMGAIIAFGVVYAFIFGPLNIFVLRRLRRTVKAWLFVPSLALGMTLVVLFAGQSWGSARTVLNSVSILHATAGGRTATENTLIGLFSPTNRAFDLSVEDVAPRLEDRGSTDPQVSDNLKLGWPDHQNEGVVKWDSVPIVLFSTRLLHLARPKDMAGSVTDAFDWTDPLRPAGAVTNGTNLKLRSAYVYRSGRYQWIGDLDPAGKASLTRAGWTNQVEKELSADGGGKLLENERFRSSIGQLWRAAPDQLLNTPARNSAWLIAECEGYHSGLNLSDIPYSNQAGLLLVQLPAKEKP